jgi:general secretion pathway protein D
MRSSLLIKDLEKKLIQLSYVDAGTAIEMLDGFGVTTFLTPSEVPDQVDWKQLPYVALIPDPTTDSTGLVGNSGVTGGSFGLTMVPVTAGELPSNMIASPMTQLIVFFDSAHPEHFSEVTSLLNEFIDRPARQIFIEGMILEINEDGLNDLGIDWNLSNTPNLLTIDAGQTNVGTANDTFAFSLQDLDIDRAFSSANTWLLDIDIRALIQEGKAEILSRPSVLTLNNRQSTIRVGKDVPIATSTAGLSNADMLAFNFQYLPTGIMLNIRPRISADGSEVSMLIDTIVSSTVLGADLEIRDTDDKLLASAPTISSRRVQTYGRIPNNTPFIIGGLVNSEHHILLDKVPLLSDIPFIGKLFQSEKITTTKTEVIIVLTPHVLPEFGHIPSAMPKDDPRFNHIGDVLFRDAYRIRLDDVYDLAFIDHNEHLQMYRSLANRAIDRNFNLRIDPAFIPFEGNHFPGESTLVTRMVYEITKKLNLADPIPVSRLAYFDKEQTGAMGVKFLDEALAQATGSRNTESFFDNFVGRAFVISFVEGESVPQLKTVHCQNRIQWRDLTWKLNQVTPSGAQLHSVVIHNETDLKRLRRAVALKHLVEINGGNASLSLDKFHVGQYMMIPDIDPTQVHIIDEDVAKYFYQTEHYYSATLQAIEQGIDALEDALTRPEIQPLLVD